MDQLQWFGSQNVAGKHVEDCHRKMPTREHQPEDWECADVVFAMVSEAVFKYFVDVDGVAGPGLVVLPVYQERGEASYAI